MYAQLVCDARPQKKEKNCAWLVAGGDKVNYPGDCGTPTADILTVKLLLNSVVSTVGVEFMTIDIKNFYLNTPLHRYEYLRLKLNELPDDVIEEYDLKDKETTNGYVFVEVRKGIYGLPQARILEQKLLKEQLIEHGYRQSKVTPGF